MSRRPRRARRAVTDGPLRPVEPVTGQLPLWSDPVTDPVTDPAPVTDPGCGAGVVGEQTGDNGRVSWVT